MDGILNQNLQLPIVSFQAIPFKLALPSRLEGEQAENLFMTNFSFGIALTLILKMLLTFFNP